MTKDESSKYSCVRNGRGRCCFLYFVRLFVCVYFRICEAHDHFLFPSGSCMMRVPCQCICGCQFWSFFSFSEFSFCIFCIFSCTVTTNLPFSRISWIAYLWLIFMVFISLLVPNVHYVSYP